MSPVHREPRDESRAPGTSAARGGWSLRIVALLVGPAIALGLLIVVLDTSAAAMRDVSERLLAIDGLLTKESAIEWEALASGGLGTDFGEREDLVGAVDAALAGLAAEPNGASPAATLREPIDAYHVATGHQFALLRAAKIDEALRIDATEVDPAFVRLQRILDGSITSARGQAERESQFALFGTLAGLGFSGLAVVVAFAALGRRRDAIAYLAGRQDALARSERRFRALVQHSADVVAIVDPVGRLVGPDRATADPLIALSGAPGDDLAALVSPDDAAGVRAVIAATLAGGTAATRMVEFRAPGPGGILRSFEGTLSNRLDVPGIDGLVLNAHDVTERRRATAQSLEIAARWQTLVEQLPAITYLESADPDTDRVLYVSPQVRSVIGVSPEHYIEAGLHYALVHPEDLERVRAADDATDELLERFDEQYRLVTPDGRVVWVHDVATIVRDRDGSPRYWQGIMFDITQTKMTEASLRERDARVRALAERVPTVIYTSEPGPDGRWLYVSPQVQSLLGFSDDEWLAEPGRWLAQLHPDDRDWVREAERRGLAAGDGAADRRTIEYRLLTRDGQVRWVRDDATIVRDAAGEPAFRSGVLLDISRQRELEAELVHRATHDAMTGLGNRALFVDRVEHAVHRVRDRDAAVAVLFLDLDDFKHVNDDLGHPAGDEVLRAVADRLRAALRPGDTAARLGGDEFGILLEDVANADVAMAVAERVCISLAEPYPVGTGAARLGASVGVAWEHVRSASPTDLVRDADMAMYVAKRRGRGRPVLYTPSLLVDEAAVRPGPARVRRQPTPRHTIAPRRKAG